MTRKSEGATAGLRRGRTLATAGLGAATLIGGLIYAMPANAATNPTASVSMPASILNDGTPATATITLTGGDTAFTDLGSKITLTIPGDSTCAGVTITPTGANPGPGGTLSGCVFTVTTTPDMTANQAATPESYAISVTSATASGTLSLAYELDQLNATGGYLRTLATANGTAPISGPAAATFNEVPNAILKQNYTQQLFNAAVGGTQTTTVYQSVTRTDPVTNVTTTCYEVDSTTNSVNGVTYTVLNDTLNLDPATVKIISNPYLPVGGTVTKARPVYGPNGGTDSNPAKYIVVVNNGTGGAASPVAAGTCADSTLAAAGAVSTPAVAPHDVSSGPIQIPVVFKDVPLTGTFAKQIYSLGDAGISTGYPDGSYQPTNPISRQAMAALLEPGDGSNDPCSSATDSAYSDVPYTSGFCWAINDASSAGLFNGYAGGTFHPTANISRQAIAAVMFRAYSLFRGTGTGDAACSTPVPFNDVSAQSPFCGDIEWMKTNGLSNGYSDGGFHPTAPSSRQAIAVFLYQLQQLENS